MPQPDLTIVIVNWNTVGLLDDCLRSLGEHAATGMTREIIVVDNASHDGSVEHLRREWPEVQVIANTENVGFCRANNQAIRASTGELLLLINTDARVTEGCLDRMLERFGQDPRTGVVGPRLIYGDGTFQRWTAGRELSLGSCANYFLLLDRMARRYPRLAGIYLPYDTDEPFQPGWVSSAVMAVRRAALDDVGPLDERIFVYMDDVDLCQRMTDGGWNVWYAADATAVHFMGASTRRQTGKASPEALRAFNRWYERRHGRPQATAVRALEAVGFTARAAAYATSGLVRGDDDARRQARAHWTHVKLSLESTHA